MGKVEVVYCYKEKTKGYSEYYFVYSDTAISPANDCIGFMLIADGETEISIKDDSVSVSQIIELMYDCLYDKKSFKIKF
jgi:hypothetical protein